MSIDKKKFNIIGLLVSLTEFGFCLSDRTTQLAVHRDMLGHYHAKKHYQTSNTVLDITLAYNVSDWTAGYYGDIGGYMVYFGACGAETELRDTKTRVVLSGDESTRVTLRTLHKSYLPLPMG